MGVGIFRSSFASGSGAGGERLSPVGVGGFVGEGIASKEPGTLRGASAGVGGKGFVG